MSEIRFSRRMGLWQVTAQGLGVMVMLSIFVLMDDTIGAAGALAPVIYLVAMILMLVNILGYVKLVMSIPAPSLRKGHGRQRYGGAYVQVHEAQGGWLAFITGWALIIASLCVSALLAQGFARQVITLLHNYLGLVLPAWPWAAILVIISAANNSLGTQGRRQGRLIALLIVIFLGVTVLAIPQINPQYYAEIRPDWKYVFPLLLVPFVGVEIVANLQGEMHRREKEAPRALLITPVLASVLGAIITAVTVGVIEIQPLAGSPGPLIELGSQVIGGAGKPFLLVTGAFGLAIAFRGVFILIVRQIFAMSKDGYLPSPLQQMQPRFGTPIWIILLVTLLLFPTLTLSGNFLGWVAGLLYLIVLISVNLTLLRQPQTDASPFKFPLPRWMPALVLALDLFILPFSGMIHLASVAGCLTLGGLIYLLYARKHHVESLKSLETLEALDFQSPPAAQAQAEYRILVPIANPATAGNLLRLAGVLAREQEGKVIALQVVTVPDQVPLDEGRQRAAANRLLLEQAVSQAKEEAFELQTMTRVAHNVAEGILDTADEANVDLIVLGWRGYTRSAGASMGPIIDPVIRNASCDVTVAKGTEWAAAKKILIPTSGGPNAPIAARLAWLLSEAFDAQVTALYVQQGRATPQRMDKNRLLIAKTLGGLKFSHPPEQRVVVADSVVDGIVQEAQDYDLVLLGASEEGLFDQFSFGSIPQKIAARVPRTAVIVKRSTGPTRSWGRKVIQELFRLLPRLNIEEQLDLREAMRDSARPGVNYFVLIVLSSIIASLGLLLDSAAVVIGAMLVAPLMSPIMGFSLGMVLGDVRMIRLSIEAVFKGVALGIVIAVFAGAFSPFKELTGEILARTQPTLLDLVVALASGTAGAYALARKEVGAALPGVAIAAALMPPLDVVGLGLSLGEPQVVGGAFLLFITNIAAISLAGVLVFIVLGVRPQTWRVETQQRIRRGLIGFILLMLILTVPLGVITSSVVRDTARQRVIQRILQEEMSPQAWDMVDFKYREVDDMLWIVATIRTPYTHDINQEVVEETTHVLREQLERPVTLEIIIQPFFRSTE